MGKFLTQKSEQQVDPHFLGASICRKVTRQIMKELETNLLGLSVCQLAFPKLLSVAGLIAPVTRVGRLEESEGQSLEVSSNVIV